MSIRIAVIGNCQAPGVAEVLSRAIPDAQVEGGTIASMRSGQEIEAFASRLGEFDLVFTQPMEHDFLGPLRSSELQKTNTVVPFPAMGFGGYHPDFIGTASETRSAAAGYHSAIVAAAYVNGMEQRDARALLNPFTFAKLGYFREFARAKAFLLKRASGMEYDLEADFDEWASAGPFMHTPNHPTIRVLISVALKAAAKAGLKADADAAREARDRLASSVILPIYPAVAKRLGAEGGYSFLLPEAGSQREEISINQYISRTYEIYQTLPRAFFEHQTVQRVAAQLQSASNPA
jgi:hypothetical protein